MNANRINARCGTLSVAICPPSPVFSHGQLYVAFSRSSFYNVHVAITEGHRQHIKNDRLITLYIEKCFKVSNMGNTYRNSFAPNVKYDCNFKLRRKPSKLKSGFWMIPEHWWWKRSRPIKHWNMWRGYQPEKILLKQKCYWANFHKLEDCLITFSKERLYQISWKSDKRFSR